MPDAPDPADTVSRLEQFLAEQDVRDGRGRFREVFCKVLEDHGQALPDYRNCQQALREVGAEAGASGQPVSLGVSEAGYLVLLVPGLGWECFSKWLDLKNSVPKHVAQYGYELRVIPVDGLSSTAHNAAQIRDYLAALPAEDASRPVILIGYSKGTPDILQALVDYPQVARRVSAVISLAGAVGGSPLAGKATQDQANLLTHVPGSECDKGDEGAIDSLKSSVRREWLKANELPARIRYYSVVTYPEPGRVSWGLRKSYLALSGEEPRNDTQVIIFDQIIPHSTLTAFVNADHWALAVPVARSHPFIGSTFVNHNDYPREALMEALLRYVEEDLGAEGSAIGPEKPDNRETAE